MTTTDIPALVERWEEQLKRRWDYPDPPGKYTLVIANDFSALLADWRKIVIEIVETDLGRFRRVTDGKDKWFLWECPSCKQWCSLSKDQWDGKVSKAMREVMTEEEFQELGKRRLLRDGTTEILCSKAKDEIARLRSEVDRLTRERDEALAKAKKENLDRIDSAVKVNALNVELLNQRDEAWNAAIEAAAKLLDEQRGKIVDANRDDWGDGVVFGTEQTCLSGAAAIRNLKRPINV